MRLNYFDFLYIIIFLFYVCSCIDTHLILLFMRLQCFQHPRFTMRYTSSRVYRLSRNVRQSTFVHVHPRKIQVSLRYYNFYRAYFGQTRILISSCGQQRLFLECADAQADLSLRLARMSEGTFSYMAVQLVLFTCLSFHR